NEIDVEQQGSTVLLVDRANTRLDIVDPAMSEVVDSVALPTEGPQVFLAGDAAVVYAEDTGEVWITTSAELGSFDAATEPLLSLGANAAITVTPSGFLHAYSADTGQLYRVDLATDAIALTSGAETRAIDFDAEGEDVAITALGERVAIVDYESRSLWLDGTVVDLSDSVEAGDSMRLQQPGPESGNLLLATSEGLLRIGFDGAVESLV